MTYCQTTEEAVLADLLTQLGQGGRYLVDIGAGDGRTYSNTRLLLDQGWRGTRFDLAPKPTEQVLGAQVTAENVGILLSANGVPVGFDVLSLDIDGVDWWVLRALLRAGYRPRIFVCEINNSRPALPALTIAYNPAHRFDSTDYFGATLGAFDRLAEAYGYVRARVLAFNAFYVFGALGVKELIEPWAPKPGFPPDPKGRPWHAITTEDLP